MFRNKPNTLKTLKDSNPKYYSTYHEREIQYVRYMQRRWCQPF